MSKKNWKSAEEFMAELENDPDYLRRRMERDVKFRHLHDKYTELARPILDKLRAVGIEAESIEALVKTYAPLSTQIVSILLEQIESNQDARHCESIVRALGAAQSPFDGHRLSACYDSTNDESLRWAIANTIALARPHSIEQWIDRASPESPLLNALTDLGYFS